MNQLTRPVGATVIYGLICGLLYIPLAGALFRYLPWYLGMELIAWACLAVYGLLLARWSNISLASVSFPLGLLGIPILFGESLLVFFLLALAILSWIRSSLCYRLPFFRAIVAETALCAGGWALVVFFTTQSPVACGLGIWMFFLIQSTYFVLFVNEDETEEKLEADPFEKARRQAEKILSS